MQNQELIKRIEADGVKFLSLQFTDLLGTVKSVDIPAHRVPDALEQGVWFDGSSVEGFARIQESDMFLMPDPATYCVLPWTSQERRRARLICDIKGPDGKPFTGDPRAALRRELLEKRSSRASPGCSSTFSQKAAHSRSFCSPSITTPPSPAGNGPYG